MKVEGPKILAIVGIISLMAVMLSACVSTGLIAGQVAADAAVNAVKGKLAEGERVTDLGKGQYLITVKAPAMSLGDRFKAVADETARQNGYTTYDITSTSVSQGSDTGSDLSLLTGIIYCRREKPKPESPATPATSVEPKTEPPSSSPSAVEPTLGSPASPPAAVEPKTESLTSPAPAGEPKPESPSSPPASGEPKPEFQSSPQPSPQSSPEAPSPAPAAAK